MIVHHQASKLNWITPDKKKYSQTLVLGSFNPWNPTGNNKVDYYYGRSSNHFWPTIASIIKQPESYFFDSSLGFERKCSIMHEKFSCLDVIDNIKINSDNPKILDAYIQKEIYSNYLDQTIWNTKTKYNKEHEILLTRQYNRSIISFLDCSPSIKKVIHTMGSNRISIGVAKPKEKGLGIEGFDEYFKQIITICKRRNIEFVYQTFSPSGYAVKTGKTNKHDLKEWLNKYLWL